MGLKSYKKFKFQEALLEVLADYGISRQDLTYLPEALKLVKEGKLHDKPSPIILDEKQKKKIEEKQSKYPTPEQLVEMFSGDLEEFYPNGKPKSKTKNN